MSNIEVVQKYLRSKSLTQNTFYSSEMLEIISFLRKCDEENLKLVAIGFRVFDGDFDYADLDTTEMYEGGFGAVKIKDKKVSGFKKLFRWKI